MSDMTPGITPAGAGEDGVVWSILGQTYSLKCNTESCFAFETFFPPGTFVPPHIHPSQDEFIHVLDGQFDLMLAGEELKTGAGDLVRMPRGIPHGIFNNTDTPVKAMFWVSPARNLKELFDRIHNLTDPGEVVRIAAEHEVEFLPPPPDQV